MPLLTLLTRDECGLCEDVARDLQRLGCEFDTIDVERDEALERRYGEAIPVLLLDGRELARAPIDAEGLKQTLTHAGILT